MVPPRLSNSNVTIELFRSSMHQDAHEFLNYLLNSIAEDVETYQKKMSEQQKPANGTIKSNGTMDHDQRMSFIAPVRSFGCWFLYMYRIGILSQQLSSIHVGTSIIRRCLFEWDKMPHMRNGMVARKCGEREIRSYWFSFYVARSQVVMNHLWIYPLTSRWIHLWPLVYGNFQRAKPYVTRTSTFVMNAVDSKRLRDGMLSWEQESVAMGMRKDLLDVTNM